MFNKFNISSGKQKFIICIILTALTFAVYWQVNQFDFVNIDDNIYIIENSHIKSELNKDALLWAVTTKYGDLWNPLVWLSFMVDYQLYGLKAGGYHVTNLILHILSTLLLFWLFHRMTGAVWKSAFVAAFFALHPLHVESVAWVSERKDVLSAFFWMLTLCFYVYYTEKPAVKRYVFVLFSFVLALMSKPMVITLPLIMILLDYWPLKRFESHKSNLFLWQLKEKMPFFILSTALVLITIYSTSEQKSIMKAFSFSSRLANAIVSYVIYLEKTFWPHNMAIFYPFPNSIPFWQVSGSFLIIILISLAFIVMAKRMPYLLVGWLWYAIAIAPVSGIIQISLTAPYAMADRYHYLPSIGIGIILAWGVPFFFRNQNIRTKLFPLAVIIFIFILSLLTWKQCGYWGDSIKLWSHALKVTKNNFMAHGNLGVALLSKGKNKDALVHLNEALRLKPDHMLLYLNRGGAYAELGQYQSAFADFDKVIMIMPDYADAYNCRGVVFSKIGQYQNALKDFNTSVRLKPDNTAIYNYRGTAYAKLGQYQLAMNDFKKATNLDRDFLESYINLAALYGKLNQYHNVIKNLSEVIRLQPDNALFYFNRGFAYAKIGQYQSAIQDMDKAILRKENYADAYNIKAAAYLNRRNFIDGCRDAKKACELGNCSTLEVAANKGLCR
ncbi:MAG: tetratricopeptide repeat protein [Smithella sp.]